MRICFEGDGANKMVLDKLVAVVLMGVLALSLVACGGGSNDSDVPDTSSGSGSITTQDDVSTEADDSVEADETQSGNTTGGINTSNWQTVVEDAFLLDIALPEGWTVITVESTNEGVGVDITFRRINRLSL